MNQLIDVLHTWFFRLRFAYLSGVNHSLPFSGAHVGNVSFIIRFDAIILSCYSEWNVLKISNWTHEKMSLLTELFGVSVCITWWDSMNTNNQMHYLLNWKCWTDMNTDEINWKQALQNISMPSLICTVTPDYFWQWISRALVVAFTPRFPPFYCEKPRDTKI